MPKSRKTNPNGARPTNKNPDTVYVRRLNDPVWIRIDSRTQIEVERANVGAACQRRNIEIPNHLKLSA